MTVTIALGRALNVPGRAAPSAALKALFISVGCSNVRTCLQTGNVIFTRAPSGDLRTVLEATFHAQFGFSTDFFFRDLEAWRGIIQSNPFARGAETDPKHHLVYMLEKEPQGEAATTFCRTWAGPESVAVVGCEVFVTYPEGVAGSKLTNAVLERRLGVRGTARNWTTVLKLAALAEDDG